MCYSQTTSLIAFTVGMVSALFAFATKQYIIGMLVLFYSQMQLSELMIWKGLDDHDPTLNRTGTTYGKYLLPTHVMAIGLGVILSVYLKDGRVAGKDWIPPDRGYRLLPVCDPVDLFLKGSRGNLSSQPQLHGSKVPKP